MEASHDAKTEKDGAAGSSSWDSDHMMIPETSNNGGCSSSTRLKGRRTTGPAKRSRNWKQEEDEILKAAVKLNHGKRWNTIVESLPGRTAAQCTHRWQKVLNPELIKGPWTPEEDALLIKLVNKEKHTKKWSKIAAEIPGRAGKQCRERWENHLRPGVKKAPWTLEEERILMKLQLQHGNKWSKIAKSLPGRPENSVKNYWNCSLKKKLDKINGQTESTGPKSTDGGDNNGDPCCMHLALSCSCSLYNSHKQDHGHTREASSDNSPHSDSDIHNNFGMRYEPYTNLCYAPPHWIDVNYYYLSTAMFSRTSYMHRPIMPASAPAFVNFFQTQPNVNATPESLLSNAGTSSDNTQSIKTNIHTWEDEDNFMTSNEASSAPIRQESRADRDK